MSKVLKKIGMHFAFDFSEFYRNFVHNNVFHALHKVVANVCESKKRELENYIL